MQVRLHDVGGVVRDAPAEAVLGELLLEGCHLLVLHECEQWRRADRQGLARLMVRLGGLDVPAVEAGHLMLYSPQGELWKRGSEEPISHSVLSSRDRAAER